MASRVMHYLIAKKIAESEKLDADRFVVGALLPDLSIHWKFSLNFFFNFSFALDKVGRVSKCEKNRMKQKETAEMAYYFEMDF